MAMSEATARRNEPADDLAVCIAVAGQDAPAGPP